ncbi:MAG: hypothetical protein H7256_16410 [Bdellovibrio sp.]|nr:hypothetical protein [Bdellovibrio sp.]
MKALYWVIGVVIVCGGLFISIMLGDSQKTVPRIKLSYYGNEAAVAEAVVKALDQDGNKLETIWIGIEPDKSAQLDVVQAVKQQIEKKNGPFDEVIIDTELKVAEDTQVRLGRTQNVFLKENLQTVGEGLAKLEASGRKYLFITAAPYSTSFIENNQFNTVQKNFKINPVRISMGYYAAELKEDGEILFLCDTEDKSGTSNWGCAVINKARNTRRKFDFANKSQWAVVMDLTAENDFTLLLRKQIPYLLK